MKYQSSKLRQMLAAEYVTGTLTGAARRRFRRLLAADPLLRDEVRYWESRFDELGLIEPLPPREQVWAEIDHRIRAAEGKVVPLSERRGQAGLTFLRLWAGVATAASLVMAVLLLRQLGTEPPVPAPEIVKVKEIVEVKKIVEVKVPVQAYVAALRLPDEEVQWTVSVLPDTRTVRVLVNGPAKLTAAQDYELWWIGDEGATSLGLLPRQGSLNVALPQQVRVQPSAKVAVSLEPAGGSRAAAGPSGPVLLATPLMPSV